MVIRFGILTVSDRSSKGERPDTSGPVLHELVLSQGWEVVKQEIVPDEKEILCEKMITWVDIENLDVILTTGGTGFSPRDITPEATRTVIEREAPGIAEAMRSFSLQITPHAMLSRATAGIRASTLIVNFPGSPKAARENFNAIQMVLEHAVQLLQEDPSAEAGH
jgi:molybdenum cofactor synthesis domain-containing protein